MKIAPIPLAIALLAGTLVSMVSIGPALADPHAAMARLERSEPTLADVRGAALRHAGLAARLERGWSRRVRLAGALPELSLRASRGADNDQDLSRSSTGVEKLDIGTGVDINLEAKAVWHLDRLMFDDAEIKVAQAAQRLHRDRMLLLSQITTLYYQRRKLQLTALRQGASDPVEAAMRALAIDELTAQLDALTGGYFGEALARREPARR